MSGASMPFKKAFTSGIPDPAAPGATNVQRADPTSTRNELLPMRMANDRRYLL
jgi:hypothetical protein